MQSSNSAAAAPFETPIIEKRHQPILKSVQTEQLRKSSTARLSHEEAVREAIRRTG